MRAQEFIIETTVSGSIATVATPIGGTITRNGGSFFSGKYSNDSTPNTPAWMKRLKGKQRAK